MRNKYGAASFLMLAGFLILAYGVTFAATYFKLISVSIAAVLIVAAAIFIVRRAGQIEYELVRARRALQTLSQCNKTMIHATDEADLLHNICRIIVNTGGYKLAWVGFADTNPGKAVIPAAQTGYEEGYLDTVNITWADTERGRGPTGTAIRTGKPYVVRNIHTDSNFAPWQAEAAGRGYASVIGLPLQTDGTPFGALTIYARDPNAFDPEEVTLLTELADDLAYGISALRTQKTLYHTESKKRAILDALPDMIVQISKEGIYKSVKIPNGSDPWPAAAEITGKHITEVLPPIAAQTTVKRVQEALRTASTQIFEYQAMVNRSMRTYEARIVICSDQEVTAIIRDITGRKARESLVEEERARIARDLHDGLAQNLYFVGLKLDYLYKQLKNTCDPDDLSSELCALKKTVQTNINDVRRTIFALRPVELDTLGFGPAVRKYAAEFGEQAQLDVALTIEGEEENLPPTLEPVFFRLVQEGLNNIAKHANAHRAEIKIGISATNPQTLTITDDGIGFDPQALPSGNGVKMGLHQMRERVTMVGGQFDIHSSPMQGTTLHAQIPQ